MKRRLSSRTETWALREPFRFSGQHWSSFQLVVCEVEEGGHIGMGEAFGVYYQGETAESMLEQIRRCSRAIEAGASREALQDILPAGGARNAIDCALWDLESKMDGVSAWERAGADRAPALSVYNIGIQDTPQEMAKKAASLPKFPLLKVKLGADRPLERVTAIRQARPDARMFVDANQAWSFGLLKSIAPELAKLGVEMIEQPLPRGHDAALEGYQCVLPLCADESCLTESELDIVRNRYQCVAIKLDKAGGLTGALAMARKAHSMGLKVVGGSMMGTSLGMLPLHVLAQQAMFSDLESPLHALCDRGPVMLYENGLACPSTTGGWGQA